MKINGLLSVLYPYHVGNFAGLPILHVSVCYYNQGHHPFQWQEMKGVQTGDQETKIVKFADDKHFMWWHQLLCQTQAHSDTIRELFCFPAQK